MGRRNAPRREVESITKVGVYGNVRYQHKLVCGHTETRPRKSTAPKLACMSCLEGTNSPRAPVEIDPAAQLDAKIRRTKSKVAQRCKVPLEQVEVTPTPGGLISYITVLIYGEEYEERQ
jgi:hypothetical protein